MDKVERQCEYCLQFQPIEQLRLLKCDHICCVECFEINHQDMIFACQRCGGPQGDHPNDIHKYTDMSECSPVTVTEEDKEPQLESLDSSSCLKAVGGCDTSTSLALMNACEPNDDILDDFDMVDREISCDIPYCDVRASHYCKSNQCSNKKFCQDHLGSWHNLMFLTHEVLSIDQYSSALNQPLCRKGHSIPKGCARCFFLICNEWCGGEETTKCREPGTDQEERPHDIRPIKEIRKQFDDNFDVEMKRIDEKIKQIKARKEEEKRKSYQKSRDEATNMIETVECFDKQLMDTLAQEKKTLLGQIKDFEDKTSQCFNEYERLMDEKVESLEQLKESTRQMLANNTIDKVIASKEAKTTAINEEVQLELEICQLPQVKTLIEVPAGRYPLWSTVIPDRLEEVPDSERKIEDGICHAVNYRPDGSLLVGTSNCLLLYDQDGGFQKKLLDGNPCVSVYTDWKNSTISLLETDGLRGMAKFSHAHSDIFQELKSYDVEKDNIASVAASGSLVAYTDKSRDKIVLIDRQTNANNPEIQLTSRATSLCFHHEDLLITNEQEGTLALHKVNTTTPPSVCAEPKWICEGLKSPGSVCVGDCGFIYVKSNNDKIIYVISRGAIWKELKHDGLPTDNGCISVYANKLAISCTTEASFKVFTINH